MDDATNDAAFDPGGAVTTCEGFALHPAISIPLFLGLVVAPIIVGAVLLRRAQRRADAQPGTHRFAEDQSHDTSASPR